MPKRVQRKRTKGWRMPPETVYVGRPTLWGNPFTVGMTAGGVEVTTENILSMFEGFCAGMLYMMPHWLNDLHGKDLSCWCKEGSPCHADILLRLANGQPAPTPAT